MDEHSKAARSPSLTFLTAIGRSGLCLITALAFIFQFGCARTAQSYLDKGDRYYEEGKYGDASINYRNSIQRSPNFAEAHYRLGLAELKQDERGNAYQEFRRAVELAPDREDARIQLADLALYVYGTDRRRPKQQYDQVVSTASYLLRKDSKSFDGLRFQGNVFAIDGRLDEALGVFRKADSIKPLDPLVVVPLMQVLFRLNQASEAEAVGKKFLQAHKDVGTVYDLLLADYVQAKRTQDAETLLLSKIKNIPKDPYPVLQLASLYKQLGRQPEMTRALETITADPKNFPRGHAIVGDFYSNLGLYDDALREYKAGLQPKERVVYQKRIAKVLSAQGKRDDAIDQLTQVLEATPDDLDARLARALLLRETEDPKKLELALTELNAVIAKNPKGAVARYNLGLVLLAKRDIQSAREQLSESAKIQPGYFPPRILLAEIAQRNGNYSETIRLADEILAVDPTNADGKLWHAAGLMGNKAYRQARAELDALLREHPDSLNVNLYIATLDSEEKKYGAAELRYLRFYKPGQQDLRPLEGLVQLYKEQKQIDKALKLIENELKQAPDSQLVHLLLASTAVSAGKLDLAAQQYEWLRSKDPKSVLVYSSLGELYQLRGDIKDALDSYQKARELSPNNSLVIAMIAYLQNASGRETEAIANLQKQLATDPQNTIAMNNLAFTLADTSTDLDRALTLAQAAQRKAPNNPGIADTVGWVYVKKGLNDSAVQIFNGLVKKYPDEPSFRYHLGVALLQKGQPAQAKAEFLITLSKTPPKDMAEKIKQILSKLG